jgi:hypothetical protein
MDGRRLRWCAGIPGNDVSDAADLGDAGPFTEDDGRAEGRVALFRDLRRRFPARRHPNGHRP